MKRIIYCLTVTIILVAFYSCTKIKTVGDLPHIEDGQTTQLTAAQIEWVNQINKQKQDSMRIVDSLISIGEVVDTSSLLHKLGIMVALVEANTNYVPNVLYYQDSVTHKPVWDLVFPFSANLNINPSTGRPYVFYNPELQAMNRNGTFRMIQNGGVQVGLSLLGNHDPAGFGNFISEDDAAAFAQIVSYEVRSKGFSAIMTDNEWTEGSYGTPLPNSYAAVLYEMKKIMPDIPVFVYGYNVNTSQQAFGKSMADIVDGYFADGSSSIPSPGSNGFPVSKLFGAASKYYGGTPPISQIQTLRTAGYKGLESYDVRGDASSPAYYAPIVKALKGITLYVPPGKLNPDQYDFINGQ